MSGVICSFWVYILQFPGIFNQNRNNVTQKKLVILSPCVHCITLVTYIYSLHRFKFPWAERYIRKMSDCWVRFRVLTTRFAARFASVLGPTQRPVCWNVVALEFTFSGPTSLREILLDTRAAVSVCIDNIISGSSLLKWIHMEFYQLLIINNIVKFYKNKQSTSLILRIMSN